MVRTMKCVAHFKILRLSIDRRSREVVAVGMNIFDRFLIQYNDDVRVREHEDFESCPCPSCRRLLDSRTYQLGAMTSLYLAIKLCVTYEDDQEHEGCFESFHCMSSQHQPNRKKAFRLQSFAELSRGQFVPQDICDMEQSLLTAVRWRVHPPTPMLFVTYLLTSLLPVQCNINGRCDLVLHVVQELARYCTELAVCFGIECSNHPASAVALAAIQESMDLLTDGALPQAVRVLFRQRAGNIMPPAPRRLRETLRNAILPELIVDNNNCAEISATRHPISMARDFGFLDVERLLCPTGLGIASTPPLSPKHSFPVGVRTQQHTSPISVRR